MTEPASASRAIDPRDLRHAFGAFPTGVTVVTTIDGDGVPRGFTANSFTSVSLEPALVLVCVARSASCFDAFAGATRYAVNVLAAEQRDISAGFARSGGDKFAGVAWAPRATGCPVFEGVAAWLDCVMHQVVEAGDHLVLVGRVLDYEHSAASPLGYCRGAYVSFGLSQDLLAATQREGPVRVGAIIEHDGAVLLERDAASGKVALPTARRIGTPSTPDTLLGRLAAGGVQAELSFLFAVFDDPASDIHYIIYRGEAHGASADAAARFVPFERIPWDDIGERTVKTMLARYVREREEDTFGIYVGSASEGRVHPLAKPAGSL